MGTKVLVLVGTKRGAFILESDRERKDWKLRGPFLGVPVRDMKYDKATGAIYAAGAGQYGEEYRAGVWKSLDLGETWTHSAEGLTYGEDGPKLEKVWHLVSAHGSLYAGVDPAGIFRSDDGGQTWTHLAGLRAHPTCPEWGGGAGGLCLHSIVPHPTDPRQIWVGISAVGAFYTADGGESWEVRTNGLRAEWPVNEESNTGYCVHKLIGASGDQPILYMQHHGGVFRSHDGGQNWVDISEGLPEDFGFACAENPHDPSSFYVVPIKHEGRFVPDGKAAVWRANKGGESWTRLTDGLPQENAYFQVLREALGVDSLPEHGIYFGTNNGFVFASNNEGATWSTIASHLPYVWAVNTAVIED